MASSSAPLGCSSFSFRWPLPTSRWSRTAKRSRKSGASKPWPQTWASSSATANALKATASASAPSWRSSRCSAWSPASSRTAACSAAAKRGTSSRASWQPAAMAWPPKRATRSGSRFTSRSSTSRRCTPGTERPEPLSRPSAPRANTKVGRCSASFTRPARMPTTPSWKASSNSASAAGASPAGRAAAKSASARSRMSASTARRSRLMASRRCASSSASAGSSARRHSMPRRMSVRRPAALMRGPMAKPKSALPARAGSRPATWNSARTPGCICPARMRLRPCATRRRLLASSRTTSATVPSATRSSRPSSLGCAAASKAPRWRSSARSASSR